ncbi:hypothetical protein KI387_007863, partial [Taxus chinensis]
MIAPYFTATTWIEIHILKQIAKGNIDKKKDVVELFDYLKHIGPNGQHVCMVLELLGDNLFILIKDYDNKGISLNMVKENFFHVLVGLDYLHGQLSIIYIDLKPKSILMSSTIDPNKDSWKFEVPPMLPHRSVKPINYSPTLNHGKNNNDRLARNHKEILKKKAQIGGQEYCGNVAEDEPEKYVKKLSEMCDNKRIWDNARDHNRKPKKINPSKTDKELDLKCEALFDPQESEEVECYTLALEGIDDILGNLQDVLGFLIYENADVLDAASPGEMSDGKL